LIGVSFLSPYLLLGLFPAFPRATDWGQQAFPHRPLDQNRVFQELAIIVNPLIWVREPMKSCPLNFLRGSRLFLVFPLLLGNYPDS